jgi:HAD superfamily hydrolase (TIGR01509 family)
MVEKLRATEPGKADQIVALVAVGAAGRMPAEVARAAIAELLGLSSSEYAARIKTEEVKNQTLLTFIKQLRLHYKIGLHSNVMRNGLEVRFPDGELTQYFDAVVASGDVGYAKPEAQAYELVADRLDARLDECIMVDDRDEYCAGARSVGMHAIQYQSFEQLQLELERYDVRG